MPFAIFLLTLSFTLCVASPPATNGSIETDGRTDTHIEVNGNTSHVRTNTVRGKNAFNSFSQFDVGKGHTANLYLPGATSNLLNLVHDKTSHINGLLNAVKDGRISGNVFFLNPYGVVIGESGTLNVGSLTTATPTSRFMNKLINPAGDISEQHTQQVLDATMPLTESGLIRVEGTINAADAVSASGGEVQISSSGQIKAGPGGRAQFNALVNTDGAENLDVAWDGEVALRAVKDATVQGTVRADGSKSPTGSEVADAGRIHIQTDRDIEVSGTLSAKATGREGHGGEIDVFADRDAFLQEGGRIDVSAVDGEAGEVEFSARESVDVSGGSFDLSATGDGEPGTLLIDPEEIIWSGTGDDAFSGGANLEVEAEEQITLDNVLISTRQIEGQDTRENHREAASTGDSGDITVSAPQIELQNGTTLLADTNDSEDYSAGNISLNANETRRVSLAEGVTDPSVGIVLDNAILAGKTIELTAKADDEFVLGENDGTLDSTFDIIGSQIPLPFGGYTTSGAEASVEVTGQSLIQSSEDISIFSQSKSNASLRAVSKGLGFVYASATSLADVTIEDAQLKAPDGDVDLTSDARATLAPTMKTRNSKKTNPLGEKTNKYVELAGAYGTGELASQTTVAPEAQIDAGGHLKVLAKGKKDASVVADAGTYDDGTAGASFAYSSFDSRVAASLGGTIGQNTSPRQVDVKSDFDGTSNIQSVTDVFGESGGTVSDLIFDRDKLLLDKVSGFVQSKGGLDGRSGSGSDKIGLAAAFLFQDHSNSTTAEIAPDADLDINTDNGTDGHLNVLADGREWLYYGAGASVHEQKYKDATEKRKKVALTAALAFVNTENSASAQVGDGAEIEIHGPIDVLSNAVMPMPTTETFGAATDFPEWDALDGWKDYVTKLKDKVLTGTYGLFTGYVQSNARSEKASLSGCFNKLTVNNSSTAHIGNALINHGEDGGPDDVAVRACARDGIITLAGSIGLQDPLGLATGTSDDSSLGVGGAYQDVVVKGEAESDIAQAAKITANDLLVKSLTDGIILPITEQNSTGGSLNINGSFSLVSGSRDSLAAIHSGPDQDLDVPNIVVDADNDTDLINISGAISSAKNSGFGASVSINELTRTTRAVLGSSPDAENPAGGGTIPLRNLLLDSDTAGLLGSYSLAATKTANPDTIGVDPSDDGFKEGDTTSTTKGRAGIGASGDVSINRIDDTTETLVNDGVALQPDNGEGATVNLVLPDEDLIYELGHPGVTAAASDAASVHAYSGAVTLSDNKKSGIAGSYSHNRLSKDTGVRVVGGDLQLNNDLSLASRNAGHIRALAAGGAVDGKAGVAGSVTHNVIDTAARTDLTDSTIGMGEPDEADLQVGVGISASDESVIKSLAGTGTLASKYGAGAAVAINEINAGDEGGGTGVRVHNGSIDVNRGIVLSAINDAQIHSLAGVFGLNESVTANGSVATNTIDNPTTVEVSGGTLETDEDLNLGAADRSTIRTLSGSLALSLKTALGAGVSVNEISSDVLASVSGNSRLDADGSIRMFGTRNASIDAIAASGSGGSGASIGGSVAVNTIGGTIVAEAGDGANIDADGNVLIGAEDFSDIFSLAGGIEGSGASAAIGGALSVNHITTDVQAELNTNMTARGEGDPALLVRSGDLSREDDGEDQTTTGHDPDISQFTSNLSTIPSNDMSVPVLVSSDEPVGSDISPDDEGAQTIHGAGIVASSATDVTSIEANVGASGSTAVSGSAGITMLEGTTRTEVNNTHINPDSTAGSDAQNVHLGAYHHNHYRGAAGNAAFSGGGAIGGAVDTLWSSRTVSVDADEATINSRDSVSIEAGQTADAGSLVVGVGASGSSALEASIGILDISGTTETNLTDSDVSAGGEIDIRADSDTDTDLITGSVAGGGAGGVGASVGVTLLNDRVNAEVAGNSVLDSPATTRIASSSSKNVDNYGATGSFAGGAGIAGTVVINVIDGGAETVVGDNATINANTTGGDQQDLILLSSDTSRVSDTLGELSGSGSASIGAVVDATLLRSGARTGVRDEAHLNASQDIELTSEADRQVDLLALSGNVGAGGSATGAVTVVNIGSRPGEDARDLSEASVENADELLQESRIGQSPDESSGVPADVLETADANREEGVHDDYTREPEGYTARVDVGDGAKLHAGNDLIADATTTRSVDTINVGEAAGAMGALGGAVSVVSAEDRTATELAGTLQAGHSVTIQAKDENEDSQTGNWLGDGDHEESFTEFLAPDALQQDDPASELRTYAGEGAAAGLGATVSLFENSSTATARVGDQASVSALDGQPLSEVTVDAALSHSADSQTLQAALGIAGVGASVCHNTFSGIATAGIGSSASLTAHKLSIWSDVSTLSDTYSIGVSGGAAAINAADAQSINTTGSVARIGAGADIDANESEDNSGESVDVSASITPRASAEAVGGAAGGVSVGASHATAQVEPEVTARSGDGATIDTDKLRIEALIDADDISAEPGRDSDGFQTARSTAIAASGGAVSGMGADSQSILRPTVEAVIGPNNNLNIAEQLELSALPHLSGYSRASGVNAGLYSGGIVDSATTISPTTAARMETGSTLDTGDETAILAGTEQRLWAESISGNGGGFTGAGALAATESEPKTTVRVEDGNQIRTGHIDLTARNDIRFDGLADSTNASVVGGGGAVLDNTVDASSRIRLGDDVSDHPYESDLSIFASQCPDNRPAMGLFARNDISRWNPNLLPEHQGYTTYESGVHGGSGGVATGSAAMSDATINSDATVDVGDKVWMTAFDRDGDPAGITLDARNDLSYLDHVSIDAGGAGAGTGVSSWLDHGGEEEATGSTSIHIGDGAFLFAPEGDVRVGGRTDMDVQMLASSKTYGLAAYTRGSAGADVVVDNDVQVGLGAHIWGDNIHLSAGSSSGTAADIAVSADLRLFNKALLPVKNIEAETNVDQTNMIHLEEDSDVSSRADTYLAATGGTVEATAYGISHDIYDGVFENVQNLFGEVFKEDQVNLNSVVGTVSENATSGVRVDGTVRPGVHRKQMLVIDADGNEIEKTDGISYKVTEPLNVRSEEQQEIDRLRRKADENSHHPVISQVFDAEADFLEAQLDRIPEDYSTPFLDVQSVTARMGSLHVDSGYLTGSGLLNTAGEVGITLRNHSPYFLKTSGLEIPTDKGGHVVFNGHSVDSLAEITGRNKGDHDAGSLELRTIENVDPLISIENTFDPTDSAVMAPEVHVNGDISNLSGTVSIDSTGSIVTAANIDAHTIDITTDGDFIHEFTYGFWNVGDSPEEALRDFVDSQEGTIEEDMSDQNLDLTWSEVQEKLDAHYNVTPSHVKANNVFISAQKINLNGIIQAGIAEYSQTIDLDMVDLSSIDTAGSTVVKEGYIGEDYDVVVHNIQECLDALDDIYHREEANHNDPDPTVTLNPDAGPNSVVVTFNRETDELILNPVGVQGGYMELYGNIFSTGNGQLRVLDGYGKIEVRNNSDYRLVTRRLDAGTEVAGTLKITDTSRRVVDGQITPTMEMDEDEAVDARPLVRIFRRVPSSGSGQKVTHVLDNRQVDDEGRPAYLLRSTAERDETFSPMTDRRYEWVRSAEYQDEGSYTKTLGKLYLYWKSFGLGYEDHPAEWYVNRWNDDTTDNDWDLLPVDESDPHYNEEYTWDQDYSVVEDASQTAHDAALVSGSDIDAFYHYEADKKVVDREEVGDVYYEKYDEGLKDIDEEFPIPDTKGYIIEEKCDDVERTTRVDYTHSLRADMPVDVQFIGQDSGEVSVHSQGPVSVQGPLRAIDGTAAITSDSGSIRHRGHTARVVADEVILNADDHIGAPRRPLPIDQQGGYLQAEAGGLANIRDIQGGCHLTNVNVAGADSKLQLQAEGTITSDTGVNVVADSIELRSKTGSVSSSNGFLTIDSSDSVSVHALGHINLKEQSGDLNVDQIQSVGGDVYLIVRSGHLRDVNPEETSDPRNERQLLGIYERAKIMDEHADESLHDTVADIYERYWREERNLHRDNEGDVAVEEDYDPNVSFDFSPDERQRMLDNGFSHAQIEQHESAMTDAYRAIAPTEYSENWRTDDTLSTLADQPGFQHFERGHEWTETELQAGISASLFKETPGTQTRSESPNVVGDTVTLDVPDGEIGTTRPDIEVRDTHNELTEEIKLALASAERSDITTHKDDDGTVTGVDIAQREDVDVAAASTDNVELDARADGHLFLGSEMDLQMHKVTGKAVRIKTKGDISAAEDVPDNATYRWVEADGQLILEAGGGSIGHPDNMMVFSQTDGHPLTVRALEDVCLDKRAGDMDIGAVLASNGVAYLKTPGEITDYYGDDSKDIEGHAVLLHPDAGSYTLEANGADVDSPVSGSHRLQIDVGEGGLGIFAPGELLIASGDRLPLDKIMSPGNITVRAEDDIVNAIGESDSSYLNGGAGPFNLMSESFSITSRNGAIGSAQQPIIVAQPDGLPLVADAENGIWIKDIAGSVEIGDVTTTTGMIELTSTQGFVTYHPTADHILSAESIGLHAGNGWLWIALTPDDDAAPTGGDRLHVALDGGGIAGSAPDFIRIDSPGDLPLLSAESENQADLSAAGDIVNATGDDPAVNATAPEVHLSSESGRIGDVAAESGPFTVAAGPDGLSATAPGGISIDSPATDLHVAEVSSKQQISLTSQDSILSASADDGCANVTADQFELISRSGSIGSAERHLLIEQSGENPLVAEASTGVWIEDTAGDLHVGSLHTSEGPIHLTATKGRIGYHPDAEEILKADGIELHNGIGNLDVQLVEESQAPTSPTDEAPLMAALAGGGFGGSAPEGVSITGQSDVPLRTVQSGSKVTIDAAGSITDAQPGSDAANVMSDEHTLHSADGSIGTAEQFLVLDQNGDQSITAEGANGVWVEDVTDDLVIGSVQTEHGGIGLHAPAGTIRYGANAEDILDADSISMEVGRGDLSLRNVSDASTASGGDGGMKIRMGSGGLEASAPGNIGVDSAGNLVLRTLDSGGNVVVNAEGSVTNAGPEGQDANIMGAAINITSENGTIGRKNKDLVIAQPDNQGIVAESQKGVWLRDLEGDFEVSSVEVHNGPAALTSHQGDIVDHQNDPATDVEANAISLDASLSHIGKWFDDGRIDVETGSGGLSAHALGDVLIRAPRGDLSVGPVDSGNHTQLRAEEGSIVAAKDQDGYVAGPHIVLESRQGSIGTPSRALTVGPHQDVKATSQNDLRLRAPSSDLIVDRVTSRTGEVDLRARYAIVECKPLESEVDVRGETITLSSTYGTIGRYSPAWKIWADTDLDVAAAEDGSVNAWADNGVYLNHPEDHLLVGCVTSPVQVNLRANGSILDHDGGNGIDVHGGNGVALHSRNGTVGHANGLHGHLNVSAPLDHAHYSGSSVHALPHRGIAGDIPFHRYANNMVIQAMNPHAITHSPWPTLLGPTPHIGPDEPRSDEHQEPLIEVLDRRFYTGTARRLDD